MAFSPCQTLLAKHREQYRIIFEERNMPTPPRINIRGCSAHDGRVETERSQNDDKGNVPLRKLYMPTGFFTSRPRIEGG